MRRQRKRSTSRAVWLLLSVAVAAAALIGAARAVVAAAPEAPQDEDFVPSERLPVDSAVAFPVDI
jgi:hypothetical protein